MTEETRKNGLFAKSYLWLVVAVGTVLFLYSAHQLPVAQLDARLLLLAVMLVALSSFAAIRIPRINAQITVSDIFIFMTMLLFGGEAAVLMAALEGVSSAGRLSRKASTILFNAGVMACATFLTVLTLRLCYGSVTDLHHGRSLTATITSLSLMALVQYIASSGLVAVRHAHKINQPIWHTWRKYWLWSSVTYFAGALAAGISARLVDVFGFYFVVAMAPVIAAVYFTYRTYLTNVEVSGQQAEQAERHVVELSHHIAEQERIREALARSEEQLRQSQKMEAVGQLAGGVAHDFNNLMTAITGYSALMLDDLEEDSLLRPDIEEIKRAAERAAGLTRQLLAFSRKQMLQPKVLDLNTVVTDMHKMLERLIGENILIISDLDPELACVEADPSQVEQVIMNLAVNARDAMPDGGRLTIETRNLQLDDAYRAQRHVELAPGRYVMLAVSDTGCGIDADMQTRIFEPFFTTKELGKGTGLGLSTVHGIVVQSGGNIHVRSEIGLGTTFDIYLPQVEDVEEMVEEKVDETTILKGTQTILLVEDEETVRRLAARIIKRQGFHLLQAGDGIEALRVAEDYQFVIDLMLSDVVMPEMRGPELAEQIALTRPQMPVLFMSGYNDTGLAEQAGVNFIQKPFAPKELLRRIHAVLEENKINRDKQDEQDNSKTNRGRW